MTLHQMFNPQRGKLSLYLLLLSLLFCVAAGAARADIIPDLPSVAFMGGGEWEWSYNVIVTDRQVVTPGDFFTIYDFAGLIAGTDFAPSSDWVFSSAATGVTPPTVIPADSPLLPNLTWTWMGAGTLGTGLSDFVLGDFGARSIYDGAVVVDYAGSGTSSSTGLPHANMGPTLGPEKPPGEVPPVPEPGSLALLAFGSIGMLGKLRHQFALRNNYSVA